MATEEADFHLRVRRKFQEKLHKDVVAEDHDLLKPMGYKGPPVSAFCLSNLLWLTAAGVIFYYTDFPITVLYDPRAKRLWVNLGLALISINVFICLFLVGWLYHVRKVASDDWEKRYPTAIPIATAAFVFGGFFLMVGLWPIWNILTPVILFTLFMGVVVLIAMLPSWL